MDVKVDGPTATVTDQDGRHRAILAQQEGLEAIPVAVRRTRIAAPSATAAGALAKDAEAAADGASNSSSKLAHGCDESI